MSLEDCYCLYVVGTGVDDGDAEAGCFLLSLLVKMIHCWVSENIAVESVGVVHVNEHCCDGSWFLIWWLTLLVLS